MCFFVFCFAKPNASRIYFIIVYIFVMGDGDMHVDDGAFLHVCLITL